MNAKYKKNYERNKRDLNILIIDDDPAIQKTISKILRASNPNYYIQTVGCVDAAIELVKKTYWDTILLDLSLPLTDGGPESPENGLRTLDILKNELKISAPIIAITGYEDDEKLSETVLDMGAYYFLTKPVKTKSLSAIVKNATKFQMTGFDGLTGLLNKITFEERLKSEFERVKRKNLEKNDINDECIKSQCNQSYISLIFLDGDNFKTINDTYSHLVGDQVLKKISSSFIDENLYKVLNETGESVKYIIRPYDIAARFGGDEFSIFLPETNQNSALVVAKRIKELIKKFNIAEIVGEENAISGTENITLSIGIATYPDPNIVSSYTNLIEHADAAMYASKKERKGHIYGYNSGGILTRMA